MSFQLGRKSQGELVGVHPLLAYCLYMTVTDPSRTVDVSIFDGVRSTREQAIYKAKGVSFVDTSEHQLGRAGDLVPFVEGRNMWDASHIKDKDEQDRLQKLIDKCYDENNMLMQSYAKKVGIELIQFAFDKPHYQMKPIDNWDIRKIPYNLDV